MTLISSVYVVRWINLWKELCSRGSPCTMTGHVWPLSTLYVRSLALSNSHMCGGNLGALGSIVEDLLGWIILSNSGDWVICYSHNTLGLLKWKLQGILYSNMKIQSSFNHRHVIYNLYDFISYVEKQTNKNVLKNIQVQTSLDPVDFQTIFFFFPKRLLLCSTKEKERRIQVWNDINHVWYFLLG